MASDGVNYAAGHQYHMDVIRGPLTKNLGSATFFEDLKDEISLTFPELLPVKDEGGSYFMFLNSEQEGD